MAQVMWTNFREKHESTYLNTQIMTAPATLTLANGGLVLLADDTLM